MHLCFKQDLNVLTGKGASPACVAPCVLYTAIERLKMHSAGIKSGDVSGRGENLPESPKTDFNTVWGKAVSLL